MRDSLFDSTDAQSSDSRHVNQPRAHRFEQPLDSAREAAHADQKLLRRAYRLLARREHSAWELRQKLRVYAEPAQITQLLTQLQSERAQSDQRFAEQFCRQRVASGRGPVKIQAELTQHCIDPELVAQLLARHADQWRDYAAQARTKKFGESEPASFKEWARQARFLHQRGFGSEHIPPFAGQMPTA